MKLKWRNDTHDVDRGNNQKVTLQRSRLFLGKEIIVEILQCGALEPCPNRFMVTPRGDATHYLGSVHWYINQDSLGAARRGIDLMVRERVDNHYNYFKNLRLDLITPGNITTEGL